MNILVTVDKFGVEARKVLEEYSSNNHTIFYNSIGKKVTKQELIEAIDKTNPDIIIAGTETYDIEVLDRAPKLKIISRVGIGIDAIDLVECENRSIEVINTPDAPSNAVAELTLGQIFNTIRKIQDVDRSIRDKGWFRYVGKDLIELNVGLVGHGRIGSKVCKALTGLCKNIYVYDIDDSKQVMPPNKKSNLSEIIKECDIISFHVPLTDQTKNLITYKELDELKKDCILINTSRGGIINEDDLYEWLSNNPGAMAAIDVFNEEPYIGKLSNLSNCYLTSHLGSCTIKARLDMEVGAVENIKKYL